MAEQAVPVRTVEVRSPSPAREAGQVIRAVLHIVFWSAALLGASWKHAQRDAAAGKPGATPADEVAFRDLASDDQRIYRNALEGLVEAEDARSRDKAWPTVEALAARRIPPFAPDPLDRGAYAWKRLEAGGLVNYVGTPGASGHPTFLVVALEPQPGEPADPQAVVDETHHRLADGTMIHVSIWIGGASPSAPIAQPAYEDGWRRVTMGTR
ncbi:MAG: hypothetical protein KIT31_25185 [Deltaproteobacteria bacterium]|nr:hypothetical protein [Deltaproteobacteria bacterium]